MIKEFEKLYGKKPEYRFSAPGRTELSGNHTDHQHGVVLAAAVNMEAVALVAVSGTDRIRLVSKGHESQDISINDLDINKDEYNTSRALLRGTLAAYKKRGAVLCGMDIYIESTVLRGSGLSSSAAYEVLLGNIVNTVCMDGKANPVEIAQIGQWVENNYFGKPCGLMDQMASSVGNIVYIDFKDTENPVIEKIDFDFDKSGYALCIIDSGANHEDLTPEYASITNELGAVSGVFGKKVLREVDEDEFYRKLPEVRKAAGDRGALRAIHIFNENARVRQQVAALKENDFEKYMAIAKLSGLSSYMLLQNVIPTGATKYQEVAFALALAEKLLKGRGVCRVQGGGFAGTIQAFVPNDMLDEFKRGIDAVLGEDMCKVLKIRHEGGTAEKL